MKSGHAVARVTFTAARDLVRDALEAGWSAKAIYDRNQPKLAGISYRQFVRYVNEMRTSGVLAAPPSPATPSPSLPTAQGKSDVGHSPRAFQHEPEVKPSTRDRILGTRKPD